MAPQGQTQPYISKCSQSSNAGQSGVRAGSTSSLFIEHLIERCKTGFEVQVVATSRASEKMAREGGIEILNAGKVVRLDLTIDGADEIDPQR